MKLSTICFLGLLGARVSNAIMMQPAVVYQPSGSVVGDFTSVDDYPPKVVLNFLAACSNVTLDIDSCLVSTFAELRVKIDLNSTYACEYCFSPDVNESSITASAIDAQSVCTLMGDPIDNLVVTSLVENYGTIVEEGCWLLLRDEDVAAQFVESKWLYSCADTPLPYPIPDYDTSDSPFAQSAIRYQSVLTCMLDRVFETSPLDFGLAVVGEGTPEACYPPGYDNITAVCSSILGPQTFAMCKTPSPMGDDPYSMDYDMSMDYRMSMDYSGSDEDTFVSQLCYILESLSSEVGLSCLMDICDVAPTTAPLESVVPSIADSAAPSFSPSLTSSDNPSDTLSNFPSDVPSVLPSDLPSSGPSETPTSIPSIGSSSAPSSAPSMAPSAASSTAPSTKASSSPSLSAFPTTSAIRFNINTEFFWAVTFNITNEDLLSGMDALAAVIEISIENLVDGPSNATVYGPSRPRRTRRSMQLESFLDFDVQVSSSRACNIGDCDLLGNLILSEVQQYLNTAASNGDLANDINQAVEGENILGERVAVVDYRLLNETFEVLEVVASAGFHLSNLLGVVAGIVSLFLV